MKLNLLSWFGKASAPVVKVLKTGIKLSKKNSNVLLTILAVAGILITSEELVRATVKAVKLCESKGVKNGKEVIRTVWKLYIPAVGFLILTTVAVVGNARINAKRLATVTGLYTMSQADLRALKDKTKDVIGPKKAEKMEEELVKDKMNKSEIPPDDQIVRTGHGDELMQEYMTGQWMYCSPDYVDLVYERLNQRFDKECDGIVQVAWYLEQFKLDTHCWIAEAYWDAAELVQFGDDLKPQIIYNGRKMVNGVERMTSCLKPTVNPTF